MARLGYLIAPLILWGLLAALFWRLPNKVCRNGAMYLQMASMLLDGNQLYVDVLDLNPPLITYLSIVPALLSRWTGIGIIPIFKTIIWLWTGLAAGLIASFCGETLPKDRKWIGLFLIAFLIAGIFVQCRSMTGEREHLLAFSFFPYLFLRWRRSCFTKAPPPYSALLTGVLAAVSIALKPYYLLPWVLVESYFWRRPGKEKKIFPTESRCVVGFLLLYAVHFLFLPRPIFSAFWGEIFPQVLKYYHTLGQKPLDVLMLQWPILVLGSLFCAHILFWGGGDHDSKNIYSELSRPLAVAALSFLFIYALQGKGWAYHMVPAHYALLLTAAVRIAELSSEWWNARKLGAALPVLLILMFYLVPCLEGVPANLRGQWRPVVHSASLRRTIGANWDISNSILVNTQKQDKVVVFSPYLTFSQPAMLGEGRLPGTRYMFMYPISFFNRTIITNTARAPIRYKSREEMPQEERTFLDRVIEDVNKNKPKLLVFPLVGQDDALPFLPLGFDVFQYARANGFLEAVNLRTTFHPIRIDDIVMIYRRNDEPEQ